MYRPSAQPARPGIARSATLSLAVEILWFPADKGLPKWRRQGSDLFMGIDHTAIVVGSIEANLHFYRDLIGMRVAGESENYGPEQEHLNSVFGAHVRITSLRAETGPGAEFWNTWRHETDGPSRLIGTQ